MEQRRLGSSGLTVSRFALGTMTWGIDTDIHEAREQLDAFLEAGGTLVHLTDVATDGGVGAAAILGTLLTELDPADDLVVAATGGFDGGVPRPVDASRRGLLRGLDRLLTQLDREQIDLWLVPGSDGLTPWEETLAAAEYAVATGRTCHLGVASDSGWRVAAAAVHQRMDSRTPLIACASDYSLLDRGAEDNLIPAADTLGVGLLPISPLGRGILTGKYRHAIPPDSRAAGGPWTEAVRTLLDTHSRGIVDAVITAAQGLEVPAPEVALAWLRDRPGVVSPVLGARTAAQLRGLLGAEVIELPAEILAALDDVSSRAGDEPIPPAP